MNINLEKTNKKRKPERFKKYIARLVDSGNRPVDLAEKFNLPLSTVYYWYDEFKPRSKTTLGWTSLRLFRERSDRLKKVERELELLRNSPFIQSADRTERMILMEKLLEEDTTGEINAEMLSEAFDIGKSTFRNYRINGKHGDTELYRRRKRLKARINKIYYESNRNYGAKKILSILRYRDHERVSEPFVREMMHELGIMGRTPRQIKRGLRTTAKAYREKRNILKQNFKATKPNQKWVMDCKSFVGAKGRTETMCAIVDLYGRSLVAYHLGPSENTNLIARTLRKAVRGRNIVDNVVLHTDGGAANRSVRFEHLLKKQGFIHSYSDKGNPFDDAPGESFFSHFSAELLIDVATKHPFKSERDMRERIVAFVDDYNNIRPHLHNGGLTPKQKESEYVRVHRIDVDRRS